LLKGTQDELANRMLVVQYGAGCEKWDNVAVMWNKWRLLSENELYDLTIDPHQDTNVADNHPEVVKAMRDHYEDWRQCVEPLFNQTRYIHIGSESVNPMVLYASDWDGDNADNPRQLTSGTAVGAWHVIVEQEAEYEIELRRWHGESKIALNASAPLPKNDTRWKESARPIARARLKIGEFDQTIDTPDGSTAAAFVVPLKAGKTKIETWFLDRNGEVLCSAFYTQVKKK